MNEIDLEEFKIRMREIKILYDIGEAENHLLQQLQAIAQLCGWSPALSAKLMKCLAAMIETTIELQKEANKK